MREEALQEQETMESEEYREMAIKDQEKRNYVESDLDALQTEDREQHLKDETDYDKWYDLDKNAQYHVNLGFQLLWEAKRFQARVELNKKAFIK